MEVVLVSYYFCMIEPDNTGGEDGIMTYLNLGRGSISKKISNARVGTFSLEQNGFQIFPGHATGLSKHQFYCEEIITSEYYNEISQILGIVLEPVFGECTVIPINHMVRNVEKGGDYVAKVHTDYSLGQGKQLAEKALGKELDTSEFYYRIVNVWRSIMKEPISQNPLAVLDTSSVKEEDISRIHLMLNNDRTDEHSWYYYPEMTNDELLVFNQYYSGGNLSDLCYHTSFEIPKVPNLNPRESIESRFLVMYKK